jgi:hypothetical protein
VAEAHVDLLEHGLEHLQHRIHCMTAVSG